MMQSSMADRKTNQRRHPRTPIDVPIAVQAKGARLQAHIQFTTHDISEGGAFIVSDLLFEIGEELLLTFALPGSLGIRVSSKVVRVQRASGAAGMGIVFIDLTDANKTAIARLVASLGRQP